MSWNYRIIKRKLGLKDESYAIHEAYMNKDGSIYAVTENPCEPSGESFQELLECYERMFQAFKKPVLDIEEIQFNKFDPLIDNEYKKEDNI